MAATNNDFCHFRETNSVFYIWHQESRDVHVKITLSNGPFKVSLNCGVHISSPSACQIPAAKDEQLAINTRSELYVLHWTGFIILCDNYIHDLPG